MTSTRKNIMLGTAGHVDHGKTAVVKLLTGCDLDTLSEEKQRGMTIDLGFAPCHLGNDRIVGVVDVPGHADFIRNMVAGAHGIDVVILVVAADDGVMPQTREHLAILTLMGVQRGLVALTKIDLVDTSRRSVVVEDVRRLLRGTFLGQAPICPLSAITGEGFDGFFDTLNQVADSCEARHSTGLFHMWVEDVFVVRGAGTVITGIPTHGSVRLNDRLNVVPGGLSGRVRRLQVYGEDAEEGRVGECVAVNLTEVPHESLGRGTALCEPEASEPATMFEAELKLLPTIKSELKDYAELHLHIGTAATMARVAMLEQPRMVAGQGQFVQLRLAEPLGIAPGQRFVVRANAVGEERGGLTTIGGGRVLGVSNAKLRRNKPATLAALAERRDAMDEPSRWCEVVLKQSARPMSFAELSKACFLRATEVSALIEPMKARGTVFVTDAGCLIHRDRIQQLTERIVERIAAFHAGNPQRLGIETEELRTHLARAGSLQHFAADKAAFRQAVRHLLATRQIEQHGSVLAKAGWEAQVSSADETLCAQIADALRQAKWTVPTVPELAASLRQTPSRVEAMLRLLLERGEAVRLSAELVMHRDAVAEAREVALALFAKAPSFTTMEFRDALGVSRKFAVPLLDYLDSIRFTVRSGNHRTPGVEAKKLKGTSHATTN